MRRTRQDDPSRPNSWKSSVGARNVVTIPRTNGDAYLQAVVVKGGRAFRSKPFSFHDVDGANAAASPYFRCAGVR